MRLFEDIIDKAEMSDDENSSSVVSQQNNPGIPPEEWNKFIAEDYKYLLVFTKFVNQEKQINEFVENIEELLDIYFKSNHSDVQLVSQSDDIIERYRNTGIQYEDKNLEPLHYYGLYTVCLKVGINFKDDNERRIFKFLDFLASAWSALIRHLNGYFLNMYNIDLYHKGGTQLWVGTPTILKADILRKLRFGQAFQKYWRIIYQTSDLKKQFESVYKFLYESKIYPKYKTTIEYRNLLEKWCERINKRYKERRRT